MARGNCYAATEALFHITGGKNGRWRPHFLRLPCGERHWFLRNYVTNEVLDPSVQQFDTPPDYSLGRGCGFLTKEPSKKAKALINALTWQST